MKKSRLLGSDVHKRRLDAGQDSFDSSQINIPNHPLFVIALVHELGETSILKNCNPGLSPGCINYYFPAHLGPLSSSHRGEPEVFVALLAAGTSPVRRLS
jgi:hypothetical protein